jgi:hypothetical protein
MTESPIRPPAPRRMALVVFVGATEIPWLRFLKPGFRHCFALIHDTENWIIYDPLAHQTEISAYPDAAARDLADWYRGLGHVVIATEVRAAPMRAVLWRPFTCVEAVKRVLGLHAARVLTPWQLYRVLKKSPKSDYFLEIIKKSA